MQMNVQLDAILVYLLKAFAAGISIVFIAWIGYLFARRGKKEEALSADRRREADLVAAAELQVLKDEKAALAIERAELAAAVVERNNRLVQVEQVIAVMKAEAVPINAAYHANLLSGLRHHHKPELDVILDKMADDVELTSEELADRKRYLKERELDPNVPEAERIKAKILEDVDRLKQIEKDEELLNPKIETVLISQPAQKTVTAPDGSAQKEDRKGNEDEL